MNKRIRKKNVGYNLTPLAIEMLKALSDYHGQSLSSELDRIIRDSYRRNKNAIERENKIKFQQSP